MKYKMTVAYEGSPYSGFQIQENANTVEAEIRKALKVIFGDEYILLYSSRTDAGVHAIGQVIALEVDTLIPTWQIPHAINANLPETIVVSEVEEVEESFHPRYHAQYKTYRYLIYNDTFMNPLYNHNTYYIHKPLDINKMQEASQYFIGDHDFIAFSTQGSSVRSTERTIYEVAIEKQGHLIEITVTGSGFLYNMVRIMVGALVQVGLGFYEPEYIGKIILSKDRSLIKRVAPAKGLTLMKIVYHDENKG